MAYHDEPDRAPQVEGKQVMFDEPKSAGKRKSLAKLRRELSEEELSTPAVQKLLIDEVEQGMERLRSPNI